MKLLWLELALAAQDKARRNRLKKRIGVAWEEVELGLANDALEAAQLYFAAGPAVTVAPAIPDAIGKPEPIRYAGIGDVLPEEVSAPDAARRLMQILTERLRAIRAQPAVSIVAADVTLMAQFTAAEHSLEARVWSSLLVDSYHLATTPYLLLCTHCGAPFGASRPDALYHSDSCKVMAARKRRDLRVGVDSVLVKRRSKK